MDLISKFTSLSNDVLPSGCAKDITNKLSKHISTMDTKDDKGAINHILRTEMLSRPSNNDDDIHDRRDMICALSIPSIHDGPFLEDCEEVLKYIKDK